MLPFVRQLYASRSRFIWHDAQGAPHMIFQAEGGEQGRGSSLLWMISRPTPRQTVCALFSTPCLLTGPTQSSARLGGLCPSLAAGPRPGAPPKLSCPPACAGLACRGGVCGRRSCSPEPIPHLLLTLWTTLPHPPRVAVPRRRGRLWHSCFHKRAPTAAVSSPACRAARSLPTFLRCSAFFCCGACACLCDRLLDPLGDHRAACPRPGALRSRG